MKDNDGDAYDGLAVSSIKAEVIDDEQSGVVIVESLSGTQVAEAGVDYDDSQSIGDQGHLRKWGPIPNRPSMPPVSNEVVTITVATDGQVVVATGLDASGVTEANATNSVVLTFDDTNWSEPQVVTVVAKADGVREGDNFSRIEHSLTSTGGGANFRLCRCGWRSGRRRGAR